MGAIRPTIGRNSGRLLELRRKPTPFSGAIAQLGERIVRNDEVVGSIPTSSTIFSITCRRSDLRVCHTLSQKIGLLRDLPRCFPPWFVAAAKHRTGFRHVMAVIQAYFDESGKKGDHPVVTFSGVCVSQPKLQNFDEAWTALLQLYGLRSLHMARASRLSEKHGYKMPRGQTAEQKTEALIPFADSINEHLDFGLIQAWDVRGFNALSTQARHALGNPNDPYYIAFARGLPALDDSVQPDDHINLICDDDRETAWDCYRHYRGIGHADPHIRDKIISLCFAKDEHFPALQAADMVASCRD